VLRVSFGRQLLESAFWSTTGTFALRILTFASTVLAARILGKHLFGQFTIVYGTIAMFEIVATFGLGKATNKFVAEFRETDPDRAGRVIVLSWLLTVISGGVLSLTMLLTAPLIARYFLSAAELTGYLRIGAILILLVSTDVAQKGTLAGMEAFRSIARCEFLSGVMSLPLMVGGVYFWGISGALWGLTLAWIGRWIVNRHAVCRESAKLGIPLKLRGCWREREILFTFSLPLLISMLAVHITNWGSRVLLANEVGGFASVGILNAAAPVQGIATILAMACCRPLISMLASQKTEHMGLHQVNILLGWLIASSICLPFVAFPQILGILFGQQYDGVELHHATVLVSLTTVVFIFRRGIARVLIARGMMWFHLIDNVVLCIAQLVAVVMLVSYGAQGVALALLIGQTASVGFLIPACLARGVIPACALLSWRYVIAWAGLGLLATYSLLEQSTAAKALPLFLACCALIWLICGLFQEVERHEIPSRKDIASDVH
jgi:O-antigen/teichoic acid export membrane protein